MATFTKQLSQPNASVPKTDTGRADYSTAATVSSAASLVRGLGSLMEGLQRNNLAKQAQAEKERKEQERLQAGVQIGEAQTSILDLEDERNALIMQDQQLQRELFDIHKDGVVTEEEQQTLRSLEKTREKLLLAKQSGVLNPMQFQTRLNALHKQALADSANLAIQPEINALFRQGRSLVTAPQTPGEAVLAKQMDEKYGVGNWTGADVGREQAKVLFQQNLIARGTANLQAVATDLPVVFHQEAETAMRRLQRVLRERGSIPDDEKDLYLAQMNSIVTSTNATIDQVVKRNREAGIPIDQDSVRKMKEDMAKQRDLYMQFMDLDDMSIKNRLNSAVDIMKNVQLLQSGTVANAASSVLGGGSGGDILTLGTLLSADEGILSSVIANLPPAIAQNTSVKQLKEQIAMSLQSQLDGTTLQDLKNQGLINQNLAVWIGSVGLRNADTPKAYDSYLSSFEDVPFGSQNSALDALNDPTKLANLQRAQGESKQIVQQRLQAVADSTMQNILDEIDQMSAFGASISVDREGNLKASAERSTTSLGSNEPRVRYLNSTLKKFQQFLRNNKNYLGEEEEYIQFLLKRDEEEEVSAIEARNR